MLKHTCDISWDIPSMGYTLEYTSCSSPCLRKPENLRNQHFKNARKLPAWGYCVPGRARILKMLVSRKGLEGGDAPPLLTGTRYLGRYLGWYLTRGSEPGGLDSMVWRLWASRQRGISWIWRLGCFAGSAGMCQPVPACAGA